ncbi:MAG: heme-degrading domain-containing protein [Actinomycetia bacterium]|nr:heme-degrading domain-containing protein [Actinomycetes bacterium]
MTTADHQAAGPEAAGSPGDRVAELAEQETALVLPRLTNDDAWRLGCLLVGMARERGAAVTVDIRRGPQQLFHCALEGTTPDNDAWLARKARVVERYQASSLLVGERFRAKGTTFEESSRLDPDRYAAHGGAFPLRVTGVGVVGVVGVSGLPQAEDHALVVDGLTRFLDEVRTSWNA